MRRGEGRVDTGGQGPTRLCYTPPTLSTHKLVIGTGNHKGSLGDSRLSNRGDSLVDAAKGEKVKLFSN